MNPAIQRDYLRACRKQVADTNPFRIAGRLTRINGLVMEASGLRLPLGANCRIESEGAPAVEA